ncbi:ribonucleoside-diphosphate reductase alpha chain [Peptoclostridium litorale DSM 5388]|uniref:Adenosylcobalamin-dependent ribonucleoside-triphosphate reductase n=1 Tax=Peptoclostridium litorale DSM 5388 TaxID=1121324 RepID=A0A069RDR1_PEPLI|nr:ribonucleoside-triphosphate reductase, adenosylcobalamin-dependent [Peptoclostridium litorale]KDR94345.1 putative adenosylcobalamin-dependent ribonucleoside-triphosphate reductase [Peptoclostridium litorale DSM 5388]SIO29335.1 ribonucleoside-diphosphate reductase alpha chain [Peptoclostridium litorale DSM 5388]
MDCDKCPPACTFTEKYKGIPSPMSNLGKFIYYKSYSRWNSGKNRMERWHETVKRSVEYNCSLVKVEEKEKLMLLDNMFYMRQFLAGRTLWIGGTKMASISPMSNYNCAFIVLDDIDCFMDIFYLLMLGCGVGVRILKDDSYKMSPFRSDFNIIHKDYEPVPKHKRITNTSLEFIGENTCIVKVGDSREGWANSLDFMLKLISKNEYRFIDKIVFDYDNVRPKGERLETFGGFASGHETLLEMFSKISSIVKMRIPTGSLQKLMPIDLLDIVNIVGENVSAGGVRRSAEMIIIDSSDNECISSKLDIYRYDEEKRILNRALAHRRISNNSVYYSSKPSRQRLHDHMSMIMENGEPGILNSASALKRKPTFKGINPCAEVLLDSRGVCNLTTVNLMAFVKNNSLDVKPLCTAQRLSARAAVRMNSATLELSKWDNIKKRDQSIGCSLTGWHDMVSVTGMNIKSQISLLKKLRDTARKEAFEYCRSLGRPLPDLVTTIKPEGTLSQMAGASQGIHYPYAKYYMRRIRVHCKSPLSEAFKSHGYTVINDPSEDLDIIEFPVKSSSKITAYSAGAIRQLENYSMFMRHYVDHNCSVTISVKKDEWNAVSDWIWANWDEIVAISIMPYGSSYYPFMPCEAISKEMYENAISKIKDISENEIESAIGCIQPSPGSCCY